jgi:PII-like signaling protein
VNQDCLKLTSYFGERQRTANNGFAADALLDLYGRHGIATSILLRGAEGFGAGQHLRTDVSLSLSEDLPLTAVAVDTRSRIEGLLDSTADLLRSGLVTLERARLLTGDIEAVAAGDAGAAGAAGAAGRATGEETKLTVYVGRQERVYRVPAFVAVCDLLHRRGIAGATALLGVDGTAHGERERAAFFSRNAGTPMMVIAVGSGDRIARVLPELGALLRQPLMTLERVRICKRDGELICRPSAVGESRADADGTQPAPGQWPLAQWPPGQWPPAAAESPAQKLMVYTSEAALHDGQPIHRAIVRRLRAAGISGATTQRGMWGFHGDHPPHGDRLLQLGRHVPAVTIVVDTPERIQAAFDIVGDLTAEQGLVTCETVPVTRQKPVGARRV